jgi:hypothetical protein
MFAFSITIMPIWPATGSGTGSLNRVGPSVTVLQRPSPTAKTFVCSVKVAPGARGALEWIVRDERRQVRVGDAQQAGPVARDPGLAGLRGVGVGERARNDDSGYYAG